MSFTGDLEHLPIVDVNQLLHGTRKSGTLTLQSSHGGSQLGFRDGYIVSAHHINNEIRIGQILLQMNALSPEVLEQALAQQKSAGNSRKPLIATLIEGGIIDKSTAFKGLETLIEMTIVDILTWTEGTFTLDIDTIVIADDYRYFPDNLEQEVSLNTQNVLMDALRIFDESMRDGTPSSPFPDDDQETSDAPFSSPELSAGDLGLDDLDALKTKIPNVFSAIKEHVATRTAHSPVTTPPPAIPDPLSEKAISSSNRPARAPLGDRRIPTTELSQAVIIYSRDTLINQNLTTICKEEGFFVFTTDDQESLDHIIDQSMARQNEPLLVIAPPDDSVAGFSTTNILSLLQQKRQRYPQLPIIQITPRDNYVFSLQALQQGARTVFPQPSSQEQHELYVKEFILFLEAFPRHLKSSTSRPDTTVMTNFTESLSKLPTIKGVPEASTLLLRFTATLLPRSLAFTVSNDELSATLGTGITPGSPGTVEASPTLTIPLRTVSVFQEVVRSGESYFRHTSDPLLRGHLFDQITPPQSSKILLQPIRCFGRTIALIYGDFGSNPVSAVNLELLEILAQQAGMALENCSYRQQTVKPSA
ncbi:MAG TPA: DUF4388 domain-containing protein [Geobacterales bacterium]|nr:DUF4388 domain-containing protein [Geobacterales bacterium]